jgi:predicted nucleotidyltransferase component of viral defense system
MQPKGYQPHPNGIPLPGAGLQIVQQYARAMGLEKLALAEKFRALAGRTRPRDFYDVVKLYRIGSM